MLIIATATIQQQLKLCMYLRCMYVCIFEYELYECMYVCVVPIQTVNRIPTIARSAMKLVIVTKKFLMPRGERALSGLIRARTREKVSTSALGCMYVCTVCMYVEMKCMHV